MDWLDDLISGLGDLGVDDIVKLVGAYGGYEGWFNTDQEKAGYQGKIPDYTAVRDRLPTDRASVDQAVYAGLPPDQQEWLNNATPEQIQFLDNQYEPRRPGEYGQRYFTDTTYAQTPEANMTPPTLAEAQSATDQQALELTAANRTNHFAQGGLVDAMQALKNGGMRNQQQQRPPMPPQAQGQPQRPQMPQRPPQRPPQQQRPPMPQRPQRPQMPPQGIAAAPQARYQRGPTDGMGDQVPAMIDGQQPAAMSHGEVVIPADAVSHLGNGNSEAGAQEFYSMVDRLRQARTGSKQQAKKINPNTFLPS